MERRVDLPQPEGPAIDTYSPFLMSIWMPERAWVSTSSVRKTLVTPSSLMREGLSVLMWLGFQFANREGDWPGGRTRGGRESYRISALVLVGLIGGDEE